MNWTSSGFHDCVNMMYRRVFLKYTLSWPIFHVCRTWIVQALDSLIVWICTRYPGRSSLCTVHELYKSWIPWLCEHVHLASNRYSPLSRYPIYTLYANWEFWTDSQTLYRDRDNKRKHWHFYINLSISSFLRRGLVRLNARTFVQEVLNIKYRCVRALLACSCENQGERGGGDNNVHITILLTLVWLKTIFLLYWITCKNSTCTVYSVHYSCISLYLDISWDWYYSLNRVLTSSI